MVYDRDGKTLATKNQACVSFYFHCMPTPMDPLIYWIMDAISSSVDERARWFMIETAKRWRPRTKRAFLFYFHCMPMPMDRTTKQQVDDDLHIIIERS
jgi:hypothetical protein